MMNTSKWVRLSVTAAAVAVLCVAFGVATAEGPSDAKIQDLVAKLGDNDFKTREASQKELIEIGTPAKAAVEKALTSDDAEVKERAEVVFKAILAGESDRASKAIAKGVKWSFPVASGVTGSPVVVKGVAYTIGADRKLYVVDIKTGKELWTTDQFGPGTSGPLGQVVATEEMVYVTDTGKGVFAFATDTGKAKWKYEGVGGASLPGIADGKAYIVDGNGEKIVCLDAKTGKSVWEAKADTICQGAPMISDGKIVLAGTKVPEKPQVNPNNGQPGPQRVIGLGMAQICGLQVLDIKDGHELWSAGKSAGACSSLNVVQDVVYYISGSSLRAVKLADGESLWNFEIPQNTPNPNARFGGRVFVNGQWMMSGGGFGVTVAGEAAYIAGGDSLVAVDLKSGKKVWSTDINFKEGGTEQDQPANEDVQMLQVKLQARLPAQAMQVAGRPLTAVTQMTAPAIADGVGYVGTPQGLVAVELKSGAKLWQLRTAPVPARPTLADGVLYFGTSGTGAVAPAGPGPVLKGAPMPAPAGAAAVAVADVDGAVITVEAAVGGPAAGPAVVAPAPASQPAPSSQPAEKDKTTTVADGGLHALKVK